MSSVHVTTCRLCDDRLTLTACARDDEWVYVDDDGSRTGTDKDLRHLEGNAYTVLEELARRCEQHTSATKKKPSPYTEAQYKQFISSYIMLNVRVGMKGTWHTHRPADLPPPYNDPVPEHCGRPMWLRPSGWHCRECRVKAEGAP